MLDLKKRNLLKASIFATRSLLIGKDKSYAEKKT